VKLINLTNYLKKFIVQSLFWCKIDRSDLLILSSIEERKQLHLHHNFF